MELRINLDCAACCRKMKRVLLRMKEIEQHMIERQSCRVSVCGRFDPGDVAIKIRKKMNRNAGLRFLMFRYSSTAMANPSNTTRKITNCDGKNSRKAYI
nr:heavy metal-associated isoprenylated plant protein 6 isoform X2 [Ipomoea batatas]